VAPFQNPQNLEHKADAFDLGNNKDDWFGLPTSFVVTADHNPGRDDGGPSGRRSCRSGLVVVGDHPKPTQRTRMRRNTAFEDASVGAGRTSNGVRCVTPNKRVSWRHGVSPQLPPPPVVVGGGRVDDKTCDGQVGVVIKQAGTEGMAKLFDGCVAR
jgi:hypothetical protein